jgi:perosamine synthetase
MIPITEPSIGKEEFQNINDALKGGWISSKGKYIEIFEKKFSTYCGMNFGVATSNGTTALHLALAALGVKRGDEIIVPSLTFIATANVVNYCNAKPVFVDSHPDYWCIDPEKIEERITSKTKGIIPVHIYGHPCNMDHIMDIAEDRNLFVVEDAAEAHGAEYKGKKVGSFGHINCFSFYGNKILTTGEGGICLTEDNNLTNKMRILRDHGMNPDKKYWHDVIGFNYRMTNLQAAIGVAQLEKLEHFIQKRERIFQWYHECLTKLADNKLITLQPIMSWAKNVPWLYSILISEKYPLSRDDVIKKLSEEGIDSRPFFYPLHTLPPYRKKNIQLKNAERIARLGLNLPTFIKIKQNEIRYISNTIEKYSRS